LPRCKRVLLIRSGFAPIGLPRGKMWNAPRAPVGA
jgi:hypothetical protein